MVATERTVLRAETERVGTQNAATAAATWPWHHDEEAKVVRCFVRPGR